MTNFRWLRRRSWAYAVTATALLGIAIVLVSLTGGERDRWAADSDHLTLGLIEIPGEPVQPLPLSLDLDPQKVAFGRSLFMDTRLSGDGTISCASCHRPDHGGADDRPFSPGMGHVMGEINTPTVHNSAFNVAQFWDGRAATLEEQIDGPVLAASEMGADWPAVLADLNRDQTYRALARAVYGNATITAEVVKNAIVEYERSLISHGSRFDAFLRGRSDALTAEEKKGYHLFKELGCASCHQGVNAGGNIYQRFGIFGDYFADRGNVTTTDLGRFNVTGRDEDRHVFKVPALRDVALTAPYFHDGSAQSLEEAVAIMGRYQLGRELRGNDIASIAAFLHTLTGDATGTNGSRREEP